MEGRGPYRIYDPGGSTPLGEASAAFERLVVENTRLKGKIQGIKTLGKADRAPSPAPPPAACNASPLTKAGRCLCPSRCCPRDPVVAPAIFAFCSLVMAFPALTSPTPKGVLEGPRRKHAVGEEFKAQFVDLEPEWRSEVCEMRRASQCARAAPKPRAWMPGREQSWPRAQCSRALGPVPPASAQALPTVQPPPPHPRPPLTLHSMLLLGAEPPLTSCLHTLSGSHFLCGHAWCGGPGTPAFQVFSPCLAEPTWDSGGWG